MVQVHFKTQTHYDFAVEFLQSQDATLLSATYAPDTLTIDAHDPTMGLLLKRISQEHTAIMPYISTRQDTWMIAGTNRRALDQTMKYIRRFLVPTYAGFSPSGHVPQLHHFDPTRNTLQKAGSAIYPAGFYRLVSPTSNRSVILKRLELWLRLEERRPSRQIETHHTYGSLAETFQAALTAANWTEAEQCLHEMQKLHLSTADNLAFLQVQLLAQQRKWTDIWNHPNFALLAKIRVPSAVRAALLTAFHHSTLLPLEQGAKWNEAFEIFKQTRPKLGLLLTGRFGLTQAPVVQVFAYQAVLESDRTTLDALRTIQNDPQVQECLNNLLTLIPETIEVDQPIPDVQQQVKYALSLSDYDTALQIVRDIEQPVEQASLFIEIAFHCGDVQVAEDALLTFWELEDEMQQHARQKEPRLQHYLDFLHQIVAPTKDQTIPIIGNWLQWFQCVQDNPESPFLTPAIDQLATVSDEHVWTIEHITNLNQAVVTFVTDPGKINQPYAQRAIQTLINLFLQDNGFPRSDNAYDDLYEALYLGVQETHKPNETSSMALLRLVESLLHNKPGRCQEFWKHLSNWFHPPVPALETSVLEAFELLIEYGLSGSVLTEWYRRWVDHLLALPTSRDRISLEVWLAFGQWMETVPDLVSRLQDVLSDSLDQETENPIEKLPNGYRIGIFTLRESSALRVKQLLEARNSMLDVRICTEKVLNDQAKAIAQNADLVVVVWSCLSHALSYGIAPFLKLSPVHPQSSGSTSILRAIEEHIRNAQRI